MPAPADNLPIRLSSLFVPLKSLCRTVYSKFKCMHIYNLSNNQSVLILRYHYQIPCMCRKQTTVLRYREGPELPE
ncbi:hypothetical protein HanHA300_Chr06g0199741 [Helianthus annuus]|nr:hypothetical protein HanHA300_Chr06g0199741 [Helianthus annuus]KAJ0739718.1 hypothetical protein HanOQP8_Chr06g0208841 [Helianthus annuus]